MEFTQTYAHPSRAAMAPDGLRLDVATEQSRPPVHLQAMVRESLSYARLMLALYEVVRGDHRTKARDHSAYQAWVTQRYMDELEPALQARRARLPQLLSRRGELAAQEKELLGAVRQLERKLDSREFYQARQKYFDWLWKHDKAAWYVLDPVVSVHPDALIFEVFSQDESSYGRVTVPTESLDVLGDVAYGTTNIDYSRALAREMERVRNYRPAWLEIGAGGVTMATGAGEAVEKKIDLPPSWVRGFLQVQSAAAFATVDVTLSAATVGEVLSVLRRRREAGSPRSLRFRLAPGEYPVVVLEPWNVEVHEREHRFTGEYRGDLRLWGRRRLAVLERVLPHATRVEARLLGTGMPSYWSVFLGSHRFDLGLSGWTRNDWARAARFDLLAATAAAGERELSQATSLLAERLRLTPTELAESAGMPPRTAASTLQGLCARGQAMYDPVSGAYRWRPLFAQPVQLEDAADGRLVYARTALADKRVRWRGRPETVEDRVRHTAVVKGLRGERDFEVELELDGDGRVQYASCTCSWHRREKLRKGPCAHILAATALASELVTAGTGGPISAPAAPVFTGKTFVFTGALTRFTREEAHAMVEQAGGQSGSSVSRNTDFLVAGERAGSKLTKARELKIPVLTEEEFLAMLRGPEGEA